MQIPNFPRTIKLPMIPLRGIIAFPGTPTHFEAGRKSTLNALNFAMDKDQLVFLVAQKDIREEDPDSASVYQMGCVARIRQFLKLSEKSVKVNEIVIHRDKVSADYTEDKRVKLTQTEEINDFISMLSGLEFETISKESFPPSLVPVGYVAEIINDGELNVSSETGNVVYNETGMDKKYAMQIFVNQYGDVYVKERSYVPEDGNYFGYMGDGDTLFKSKTAIDFNVVHNAFLKET